MSTLSPAQLDQLLTPLHKDRVSKEGGRAHLEAWDVRRWLIRIFGFTGWDFEVLETALVYDRVDVRQDEDRLKVRATAVYRVTGRLIVKDENGAELGHWDDGATGDGVNMPSVGDAHDFALKTAMSQALKRCAVNLGDQFGLGLYDHGKIDPVVLRTLLSAPDQPMPTDPPVVPETSADEPQERPVQRHEGRVENEWQGPAPEGITKPQQAMMHALYNKCGIADRPKKLEFAVRVIGRPIGSSAELTKAEATAVIEALKTGEIPKPAQVLPETIIDVLAANIDRAPNSDELADVTEAAWRARERNQISEEQHKALMDRSMAREAALSEQIREAREAVPA